MTIEKDRLGRTNPTRFNIEKENNIVSLYEAGLDTVSIAKRFETFNTSVRRVLIRKGVKLRSCSEVKAYVKGNPLLNQHYYLGMLATDGNVYKNRIKLALQNKDSAFLETYASFLGIKVLKDPKNILSVAFKNKEVAEYLNSLGITENKSLTLRYKGVINWDFIRGCIDGDGSIAAGNPISIKFYSASIVFITQIRDFLLSKGIRCKEPRIVNGRTYGIAVFKTEDVLKMYSKLYYKIEIPYLQRKYEKYGSLIQEWVSKQGAKSVNILKNAELAGFRLNSVPGKCRDFTPPIQNG